MACVSAELSIFVGDIVCLMKRFLPLFLFLFCLFPWRISAQLNKESFLYRSSDLLMDKDYRGAIGLLNVLLTSDSTLYDGYLMRGIAKYNQGDVIGAESDFSAAIRHHQAFTTALLYRGIARSRQNRFDEALADFDQAIALRPNQPEAFFSRGVAYMMSQQVDKAIGDFNAYLKQEPKSVEAYLNRGSCNLYRADTAAAYADYTRAIRTNIYDPRGYFRRGSLYSLQGDYDHALADLDQSIELDSALIPAWFNRALIYANTNRPLQAIDDFSHVVALDSTVSVAWFNRALLRTQIGDYNKALSDYDRVARLSPSNVLVFYNRAALQVELGNLMAAIDDYGRAIELYPDFANAYMNRSQLRHMLNDIPGAKADYRVGQQKVADYFAQVRVDPESFADTSRRFDAILSFDYEEKGFAPEESDYTAIRLMPMFRFTLCRAEETDASSRLYRYAPPRENEFRLRAGIAGLTMAPSGNLPGDSVSIRDGEAERTLAGDKSWRAYLGRSVTQSMLGQYTHAAANLSAAIERQPDNPFLYLNRAVVQAEMIDFIASIESGAQGIIASGESAGQLNNTFTHTYNYDRVLADLDRTIELYPEYAYAYYNRANVRCVTGQTTEAIADYTRAIELYPLFGEAYYNRGLVMIYLKETSKGAYDLSKAGELGIEQAYELLEIYLNP